MQFRITLILLILTFSSQAQQCQSEAHRQFDFWIGEWEVSDTAGVVQGHNTIDSAAGACMLTEYWRGAGGGDGRSINYYDPTDSLWHQTWIGSNGFILHLKGGIDDDGRSMKLKSEPFQGQNGQSLQHQILWRPNPKNGTVIQVWTVLDDGGNAVRTLFFGVYQRV